jgi:hypothetical protein
MRLRACFRVRTVSMNATPDRQEEVSVNRWQCRRGFARDLVISSPAALPLYLAESAALSLLPVMLCDSGHRPGCTGTAAAVLSQHAPGARCEPACTLTSCCYKITATTTVNAQHVRNNIICTSTRQLTPSQAVQQPISGGLADRVRRRQLLTGSASPECRSQTCVETKPP